MKLTIAHGSIKAEVGGQSFTLSSSGLTVDADTQHAKPVTLEQGMSMTGGGRATETGEPPALASVRIYSDDGSTPGGDEVLDEETADEAGAESRGL